MGKTVEEKKWRKGKSGIEKNGELHSVEIRFTFYL